MAKALGFVPKMSTNKKEFEDLFTRWGVYTYTKLLSEQIFQKIRQSFGPTFSCGD